jgi:hypothetical protein
MTGENLQVIVGLFQKQIKIHDLTKQHLSWANDTLNCGNEDHLANKCKIRRYQAFQLNC